jgi:hypothetical protein
MRRLVIGLLLMVAACGPAQGGPSTSPLALVTPSPSATAETSPPGSPSPTSPGPLLFAVLEAKIPGSPHTWNTVAIVGLDGYAKAKTTFIPMPVPNLGCMGAVLSQSAHVAAGKAYFADGKGVVRSLSIQGQVIKVATFPLTSSQQMLSFAVSPDGSRLLGTVFTLPAKPNLACNGSPATGYALDVYSAPAGGSSTLLYHQSLQSSPSSVMALTGWDAVGPVGTYPTVWASQGGGPASELGVAVRIDAGTGKVLRQVADPNSCLVWDTAASGDFACVPAASARVSVRRSDGSEIWQFTPTAPVNALFKPFLAPDEQHVVVGGAGEDIEQVGAKDGSRINLTSALFGVAGWLNSTTILGGTSGGGLAYVRLSAPLTAVSMGFSGLFVGTVQN